MNKKAELFQLYLEKNSINCFQVQEIADDPLNTVVFHSSISVEGQELPTAIILDDTIYTMIRVRVAANAMKAENEVALIKLINKLNAQYKIFKYYFAEDGSLVLDAYLMELPEKLDGNMIYTALDVIVKHLLAEYKNVMKAIWA